MQEWTPAPWAPRVGTVTCPWSPTETFNISPTGGGGGQDLGQTLRKTGCCRETSPFQKLPSSGGVEVPPWIHAGAPPTEAGLGLCPLHLRPLGLGVGQSDPPCPTHPRTLLGRADGSSRGDSADSRPLQPPPPPQAQFPFLESEYLSEISGLWRPKEGFGCPLLATPYRRWDLLSPGLGIREGRGEEGRGGLGRWG